MKKIDNEIDINNIVTYKVSSDVLNYCLAAGYNPIVNRVLKLTDGYFVWDEELQEYCEI